MTFNDDSLTRHSVTRLMTMQAAGDDPTFTPVLQVLSLRNVGGGTGDRFRVVLSDGEYYIQGMLATQLKGTVESGQLQANAVIRIQDFMNNRIQDRNIIIILAIEVLGCADRRLGDATDFYKSQQAAANGGPTAAAPRHPVAAPMYNRTNTAHGTSPTDAKPSSAMGNGNPYPSSRNPYSPEKSKNGRLGGVGGSHDPIVAQSASPGGTPITLISNLNMYQNRWTIKARVISKSDIRTWSNAKGEGTLCNIEVLDASGMDIRCTMFQQAVDKFYNVFQVGSVYLISGGKIKVANARYNTCKSQYEIQLETTTEVKLADDEGGIQGQALDVTKISQLEGKESNSLVDVMGIVQEVSEVQSLTSKKTGRELQKCDITLIDDTGVQVRVTLWGAQAMTAPRDVPVHKVVAFRRAKISDYNGISLSGPQGTYVEPPIPETEALQEWWKSQGSRGAPVKSLSTSGGGAGGRMDPFSQRKSIASIKNLNLGYNSEKGDYLCFKAHFTFFKKDKEGGAWYTACPNKDDPCRNRCKVEQTTDGNWQCQRCGGIYPECTRKWIFSGVMADDTASSWVSLFDETALTLFDGATADDVFAQFEQQDVYDGYFAKATYTEWIVKARVKNEMVNDEQRVKTQLVKIEPVDYVAESRDILAQLEQWQL